MYSFQYSFLNRVGSVTDDSSTGGDYRVEIMLVTSSSCVLFPILLVDVHLPIVEVLYYPLESTESLTEYAILK
jgi:hypothetical protein